jgi:hypothetical protein
MPTQTERDRLRRMAGDRIPLGKSEEHAFFTNAEIDDLITTANGDLNLAAYAAWLAKAAEFAKFIDIDESGSVRKMSQMYKNADMMVKHYEGLVEGVSAAVMGRVVGRAICLREDAENWLSPASGVASGSHRAYLEQPDQRIRFALDYPDTHEADPEYPAMHPQAT